MVAHLLKVNVDIESRNRTGDCTPLMWAVHGGNETTVDFLLAGGALVDSIEHKGRTPPWFTAQLGKGKIAEKLINRKALVNPELRFGTPEAVPGFPCKILNTTSPLGAAFFELIEEPRFACHKEDSYLNVIRLLLGRGALVDSGSETESPLWLAIDSWPRRGHGQEVVVKMLLSNGADINFQHTERGSTPLHRAVGRGIVPMVKLILEGKPKLEVQNSKGETPLHILLSGFPRNTNGTILQMLLGAGANLNATQSHGETPLSYAIKSGQISIVPMLLRAGSDPNIASHNGASPLHAAAKDGKLHLAELLLTAGADANAKDGCGRTPLDVAQEALEGEQRINTQQDIESLSEDVSLRDLKASMKIVDLLSPITTESDGTHENTCQYQSSQRDS